MFTVKKGICMFFKREVRVTRDLSECNKIRKILAENDITSYAITNTPTNSSRYHGTPFINSSAMYQYHIYVSRENLNLSEQILNRR